MRDDVTGDWSGIHNEQLNYLGGEVNQSHYRSELRFPDYVTMAQDGGKVVSFTHRPLFTPRKYSWYSFLLDAESTPGQ